MAVEPVAAALVGEEGYSIGPEGFTHDGLVAVKDGLSDG